MSRTIRNRAAFTLACVAVTAGAIEMDNYKNVAKNLDTTLCYQEDVPDERIEPCTAAVDRNFESQEVVITILELGGGILALVGGVKTGIATYRNE